MVRRAQSHSTQLCRKQRGFTLVELLVVITIIGVLMAMLIPVIGRVREYAHRVQCISNQSQIGLAMTLYATSHGTMPSEMSSFSDTSGSYVIGWAEGLMSQLGRNDLVPTATFTEAQLRAKPPNIALLICPSDPTKVGATGGPESYQANGGCSNSLSSNPVDWNANGAWNYHAGSPAQNTSIALEFISRHDGTSTTISHSENLDAPGWVCTSTTENTQAILWNPSNYNSSSPAGPINLNVGQNYTDTLARPSSNHPGGAVIGFCDGSVKFIQQTMNYNVYATLMTSYGAQASPPGTTFTQGNPYQSLQVVPLDASLIPGG